MFIVLENDEAWWKVKHYNPETGISENEFGLVPGNYMEIIENERLLTPQESKESIIEDPGTSISKL